MITGLYTEEFYHWSIHSGQLADYSEPFRKGFSNWLKNIYSTSENLQKAWNNPSVDFNSVNVPSKEHRMAGKDKLTFRNPAADMPVIDFYLYYNDVMVEVIDTFCKAAKEATGGRKIVGSSLGLAFSEQSKAP
jgi:beta-galactosidase GanA